MDIGYWVVLGVGCRVSGIRCRVLGVGYRVLGAGCRVWLSSIGYRVSGIGYRVSGIGCRGVPGRPGRTCRRSCREGSASPGKCIRTQKICSEEGGRGAGRGSPWTAVRIGFGRGHRRRRGRRIGGRRSAQAAGGQFGLMASVGVDPGRGSAALSAHRTKTTPFPGLCFCGGAPWGEGQNRTRTSKSSLMGIPFQMFFFEFARMFFSASITPLKSWGTGTDLSYLCARPIHLVFPSFFIFTMGRCVLDRLPSSLEVTAET